MRFFVARTTGSTKLPTFHHTTVHPVKSGYVFDVNIENIPKLSLLKRRTCTGSCRFLRRTMTILFIPPPTEDGGTASSLTMRVKFQRVDDFLRHAALLWILRSSLSAATAPSFHKGGLHWSSIELVITRLCAD